MGVARVRFQTRKMIIRQVEKQLQASGKVGSKGDHRLRQHRRRMIRAASYLNPNWSSTTMPRVSFKCATVLLTLLPISSSTTARAAELSDTEFKRLHAELQPGDSPWLTIPWKISVLNAQQSAAKEDKPIFIWAMDGHPLGCT